MPTKEEDWVPVHIPAFLGGLNLAVEPHLIDNAQLSDTDNLVMEKGMIRVDTGYTAFQGAVRGIPKDPYQFTKKDGSSYLVLVTNSSVYVKVSSAWHYISDGTSTTCTAGEPAGETNIVVASITGFSDGDYVGVILDDGSQHQTTINGVPAGSTIVITDAVPTGRSISIGAVFLKAVDLSGDDDNQVVHDVVPSHDWFVFTNGIDNPKRFDGSTCEDIPNLPSGGNTQCTALAVFENHLMLLGTVEGGTAYPQRARWPDTGDPTNWSTGNASYKDLYNSEDHIRTGKRLGPYLIIYRAATLERVSYVGTEDKLFNFDPVVAGDGAASSLSVADIGDYHIFVGSYDVYEYRGDFAIDPIGDPIYYHIFSVSGELNPTYKARLFAVFVEELDEFWIFYPEGASQYPNDMLRYSIKYGGWMHRQFDHDFMGAGLYQADTSKTWAELSGTWAEQAWVWGAQAFLANAPNILLCAQSPSQVYSYDYVSTDDAGTAIDWFLTTKQFLDPFHEIRVDFVEMMAKGTGVKLEYSTNKGGTWTEMETVSPGNNLDIFRIHKQFVGESAMFKLSGTGGGVSLGTFGLSYSIENEIGG